MPEQSFPYEIVDELFRGGCAVLFKILRHGEDPTQVEPLILKTMVDDDGDSSGEQRFYMEYEFLRAYPHPNLVKVHEYYPDLKGQPAYVMEFVKGETWQAYWQGTNVFDQIPTFLDLFQQLCEVLDFIHHHHIIHRDLKPQNILVTKAKRLKLIDFGIMKVENLTLYTNRNTFMGSAYYVAPECLSGGEVTHTADIFSLGIILYDLLTGTKPFRGHTLAETVYQRLVTQPKPPSQIRDMPKDIDPLMERILHKEPHKRPQSGRQIFEELKAILSTMEPRYDTIRLDRPIDFLSQEHFFHTHLLETCRHLIADRNVLYLVGPAGSGKTTLAENLALKVVPEKVIIVNCTDELTVNEFIEITVKSLNLPSPSDPQVGQWMQILGNAFPQLNWKVPEQIHQIDHVSLQSAFLGVLRAAREPFVLIVEDLHHAGTGLMPLIIRLLTRAQQHRDSTMKLIFTSEGEDGEISKSVPPTDMVFPDVLTLSEFIAAQFQHCRVPLEITNDLVRRSQRNVSKFLSLLQACALEQALYVEDHVLKLDDQKAEATQNGARSSTIPVELAGCSPEELHHLEWIALSRSGIDLAILQKVTQVDLDTLGCTLRKAADRGLLEYQSASTEGFNWKNERIREYLLNGLQPDERMHRFRTLARTIEEQSVSFLPYSPPLWLVLSMLYREAQDESKYSEYALAYARYCFQHANYEPIRIHLGPMVNLKSFSRNQEFWTMLAQAHRDTDIEKALDFAHRALAIQESIQGLALNAILEYDHGNMDRVRALLDKVFQGENWKSIDINSAAQLIPILMVFGLGDKANHLFLRIKEQLKGRDDLFARNVLVLANARLFEGRPVDALHFMARVQGEVLPQTEAELTAITFRSSMELFRFDRAENALQRLLELQIDPKNAEAERFSLRLFLLLSFHKFEEARRLVAEFQGVQPGDHLKPLVPLFELVCELMLRDPRVGDFGHLMPHLTGFNQRKPDWAALITSLLDPFSLDVVFLQSVLRFLTPATPWVRNQIPRIKTLMAVLKQPESASRYLSDAIKFAIFRGLEMEKLRLALLQETMLKRGLLSQAFDIPHPETLLETPDALVFNHALSFLGGQR